MAVAMGGADMVMVEHERWWQKMSGVVENGGE